MRCLIVLTLIVLIPAIFVGYLLLGEDPPAPVMSDGWFGRGPRQPDVDKSIVPFSINVPDDELQDLHNRLSKTRLGEDLENVQFEYGFQVSYMKEVMKYWQNDYNWRKHEAILNQFPQFKTNIEGIYIHFIHVKPKEPTGRVLLMSHGWPGSVWEFYKILPMLTDPGSHGGDPSEAFEVICPSIPGYGYSEAAHQPGMNMVAAARIYVKIMNRLGHTKFYLQGGDWGAGISNIIAQAYPQKVLGIHLNLFSPPPSAEAGIKHLIASFFPSLLGVTDWEHERAYPLSKKFVTLMSLTGYVHIQATKPDTVAFGLNDSPVGLAAYILEKFGGATNLDKHLNSLDGAITEKFTLDELLTNVMIYWTTQSIGSSVRFYKENIGGSEEVEAWQIVKVTVPAGLAAFPEETVYMCPKALAEVQYKNIIQYSMLARGGHFAALEEPRLLADDFLSFVRKVQVG